MQKWLTQFRSTRRFSSFSNATVAIRHRLDKAVKVQYPCPSPTWLATVEVFLPQLTRHESVPQVALPKQRGLFDV
jgi:hypothetical protein